MNQYNASSLGASVGIISCTPSDCDLIEYNINIYIECSHDLLPVTCIICLVTVAIHVQVYILQVTDWIIACHQCICISPSPLVLWLVRCRCTVHALSSFRRLYAALRSLVAIYIQ